MSEDVFDDPEVQQFLADADANLRPKILQSAAGLSILEGKIDPKIAIEIGYILLLGKPLILIVTPGTKVPDGLSRAAAAILEWTSDPDAMGARVMEALSGFLPQE